MKNKIIAIDYDDTISLNVEMWKEIIQILYKYGAVIYVVTYRDSSQFNDIAIIPLVKDYVFTGAKGKKEYCKKNGIEVDIWIDDCPESIIYDYRDLIKVI